MPDLWERLAAAPVAWRTLGELGTFYSGLKGKTKTDFGGGNARFVPYRNVFANAATDMNDLERVSVGAEEKQHALQVGDVIFTGSSEISDESGMSSVVVCVPEREIYLNSFCFFWRLHDKGILLPDFMKHLFRTSAMRKAICKTASGVTRFNVSKDLMKKIVIPVPPLEIQREIVRILDTLTALTTELQTERAQRLRQYEYYRDMLLSETYLTKLSATRNAERQTRGLPVESYSLCELFHIRNGYTPSKRVKSYWQDGTVPWFRMEDIRAHGNILDDAMQKVHPDGVKGALFPAGSIIMATTATIGVHALVQVDYLANQRFTNFALKSEYADTVDMKYIYHYFYLIDDWAKRNVNASSFASVKMQELKAYRIPVPPLGVQRQVVGILDKLEMLCRDVTAGLPREMALRERQYAYYRERLLTFARAD